ncbi:MAG: PIG-L deacetylase family protein [Oceanipulchritudo sp.]
MELSQQHASLWIPDGVSEEAALRRTTHLGIGAHADDLEFMAYSGIAECFDRADKWFGGVTVTNGANPPRSGPYAECTAHEMADIRSREQVEAARIGSYGFQAQLFHDSAVVRAVDPAVVADLESLLTASRPEVLYLHQPFDKHPTHIGVLKCSLAALLNLPPKHRPRKVYGCEVWRGLDWVPGKCKVALPTHAHPELARKLMQCFRSQIKGGKRYDLAVPGRWLANATFYQSHAVDVMESLAWGLDLTPMIQPGGPGLKAYRSQILRAFEESLLD